MIRALRTVAGVMLLALASCQSDDGSAGGSVERDSAQIAIVESTQGAWDADSTAAWRVETEPAVAIGEVEGNPEYQLHRVTGALRLSDGNIIVANSGSSEIRYYDSTGTYIRAVGRKGQGPGEFEFLRFLKRYGGDSLLAWDPRLARGSVLRMDGTHARTIVVPELAEDSYIILGATLDGSLLGVVSPGIILETAPLGVLRSNTNLFRLTRSGQLDTIARLFEGESYITNGPPLMLTSMPFDRQGVFGLSDNKVHHGSGDTFEIRTYSLDGRLERITRAAKDNPPLPQEVVDTFIANSIARTKDPAQRRRQSDLYREMPFPKTLPAFGGIIVDRDDNLWVGSYAQRGSPIRDWTVFDPRGRMLGTVIMPPRLIIYEIGSDYVLGALRDDVDVEHFVLHRLIKPKS
jgi:hypothetical protein